MSTDERERIVRDCAVPPTVVVAAPQNGFLRVEWGKSVFRIEGYGVNMTVGGFSLSVESPPNSDVGVQGAAALADLRTLADRAFEEQLSWYLAKLGILEKKLK